MTDEDLEKLTPMQLDAVYKDTMRKLRDEQKKQAIRVAKEEIDRLRRGEPGRIWR